MRQARVVRVAAVVIACMASAPSAAQTVRYVDANATGANDGASWSSAFVDLQSALDAAASGDEIRIAGSTYVPTKLVLPGVDISASFSLENSIRMLGGYAGSAGPDPDVRDPVLHETVMTGDISPTLRASNVVTQTAVCSTTLDGLTITRGFALPFGGVGGGLRITAGKVYLRNCRIVENKSNIAGGGLYAQHAQVTLDKCVVDHNHSAFVAPAVACDTAAELTIRNSTVSNNHGSYSLGAVEIYGSSVTSADCTFESNGRGLYAEASDVILDRCTFVKNTGSIRGGALGASQSVVTARDCSFRENVAALAPSPSGSESGRGGAACLEASVSRFVNCRFDQNLAISGNSSGGPKGGAVFVDGGEARLDSCLLSGNTARSYKSPPFASWGGAAYITPATTTAEFSNCTITFNVAEREDVDVINQGHVGGIYGPCTVSNCIVWGNTDDLGAGQDAQFGGGAVALNWSCVTGLTGSLGGDGNTGADPSFVDPLGADATPGTADDDLRLAPGSSCIDAGSNALLPDDLLDADRDGDTLEPLPLDLDGTVRSADWLPAADTGAGVAPIVDMGAYEQSAWDNLGFALAGSYGEPCLYGVGTLAATTLTSARLAGAPHGSLAFLLGGAGTVNLPFKGGVLVPDPFSGGGFAVVGVTDPNGHLELEDRWPAGVPTGFRIYLQAWVVDPEMPGGVAASNAIAGDAP